MENNPNRKMERVGNPDSPEKKGKTISKAGKDTGKDTGKTCETAHEHLKKALKPFEKILSKEHDNAGAWRAKPQYI